MPSIKSINNFPHLPNLRDGEMLAWNSDTRQFEGRYLSTTDLSSSGDTKISGLLNTYSPGYFCYVSGNDRISKTSCEDLLSSTCVGVTTGGNGELLFTGVVDFAKFISSTASPSPGSPVYLASSHDEDGAAGKLRSVPPTEGFVAQVGICLSNENFIVNKTCKILLRIKDVIVL